MKAGKADLAQALVVTAEVMGTELSVAAAKAMARELAPYPGDAVATALRRCQRELSGRLTLAAVLQRIEDGHPGAEEAWAISSRAHDEDNTVVWTEEMNRAFFAARPLLQAGDAVAARMAFRERYETLVRKAREDRSAPAWCVSSGFDKGGRATAALEAVEAGRLSPGQARQYVFGPEAEERLLRLEGKAPEVALPSAARAVDALVAQVGSKL